jgi:hypothetical protein
MDLAAQVAANDQNEMFASKEQYSEAGGFKASVD